VRRVPALHAERTYALLWEISFILRHISYIRFVPTSHVDFNRQFWYDIFQKKLDKGTNPLIHDPLALLVYFARDLLLHRPCWRSTVLKDTVLKGSVRV
jgi:hypothetical protein